MNFRKNKVKKKQKKEKKYDDDDENEKYFNIGKLIKEQSPKVLNNNNNIENIEINLQDEFFKSSKKKSEEKSGNLYKNISLNKILDEFYNKNINPSPNIQKKNSEKKLNSSAMNYNSKFASTKQVNNLLFKNQQYDKEGNILSRSKSNPKNKKQESERETDHMGLGIGIDSKRVKIAPKKTTTINLSNKYTFNQNNQHHNNQHHNQHHQPNHHHPNHHYNNYNRYGIYPIDKNNNALKDRNLINTLKNNMETNKVKTSKNTEQQQAGHNHSLSISVVTINDEIVFNSETNPNENLFNLDDTEVLRSKNVFTKDMNSGNKSDKKTINNYDKPIIQFNQFNTFQVKQEPNNNNNHNNNAGNNNNANNKLNFFGTTNYDKIFEQPQSSNSKNRNFKSSKTTLMYPNQNDDKNKNNVPSLNNLKNSLVTNTPQNYEFNANFHHEFLTRDLKTTKNVNFDFDYLLTDNTKPLNDPTQKDKIYFFDFFNDNNKKPRNVKSVELRKTNDKEKDKDKKIIPISSVVSLF